MEVGVENVWYEVRVSVVRWEMYVFWWGVEGATFEEDSDGLDVVVDDSQVVFVVFVCDPRCSFSS